MSTYTPAIVSVSCGRVIGAYVKLPLEEKLIDPEKIWPVPLNAFDAIVV